MLLSEIGDKEIIDISKGSTAGFGMRKCFLTRLQALSTLFPCLIFREAKVVTKKICSFPGVRL